MRANGRAERLRPPGVVGLGPHGGWSGWGGEVFSAGLPGNSAQQQQQLCNNGPKLPLCIGQVIACLIVTDHPPKEAS